MILTTTNSVEGSRIAEYKGIVTGISYNSSYSHKGNKMSFKDMFNMSKYYEVYAAGVEHLKEEAFQKLKTNAEALNANAIVGISVDVETLANTNTLMISVTGTAVSIVKDRD